MPFLPKSTHLCPILSLLNHSSHMLARDLFAAWGLKLPVPVSMYLHGANFRLPPLLKGLAHAVPRTAGSLGGMFPAALGHAGCGCWTTGAEWTEWRKDQLVHMWRGKKLQEQKIPSLGGMHAHGKGAEGLHIQHEFLLTFFLHP